VNEVVAERGAGHRHGGAQFRPARKRGRIRPMSPRSGRAVGEDVCFATRPDLARSEARALD
jgi:hypothetical protein